MQNQIQAKRLGERYDCKDLLLQLLSTPLDI